MKIEKNIPMPKRFPQRYDFKNMEVGDSFVAENNETKTHSCRAYNAALTWGKRHNVKFTAKKQPDGTLRVWRIE